MPHEINGQSERIEQGDLDRIKEAFQANEISYRSAMLELISLGMSQLQADDLIHEWDDRPEIGW